ncbi:hypothetical protein AAGW05_02005 [Arthrobacter sp. LAPM80]|uniref:hypothetical protein n=1 Tax=Arthrobacter sp. LAPM80 TaxID=3141788 RepID=UPI00398B644C
MTRPPDYLYNLLPGIYRSRDAEQGYPLRELLAVMDEQGLVVEADIATLYADWFVETAQAWAVPYIGALVGYEPVHDAGLPGTGASSAARNRILARRREVAHTINFRRRKGTLAVLEQLSLDSAGWEGHAAEFFPLLGWNQHLNHQHPGRGGTLSLRDGGALDRLGGFLDGAAHSVDVRRPDSHRSKGRFNIPSIGVFPARLSSYPITDAPACCVEKEGNQCFTFSVLGHDTPLFTQEVATGSPDAARPELRLPLPIDTREFTDVVSLRPPAASASPSYFGPGRSISVTAWGWRNKAQLVLGPGDVVPANLADWHAYKAPRNKVLADPERGRLIFPAGQLPRGVTVSYHYGFSMAMGGGEYPRLPAQPAGAAVYRVRKAGRLAGEFADVMGAHAQWAADRGSPDPATGEPRNAAVIEIMDSRAYEERFEFALAPAEYLQLRAADGARPVLRLLDYRVDQADPLSVTGGNASRFVLDGLLVVGRGLVINGPAARRPTGSDDPDGAGPDGAAAGDTDITAGGDLCAVTIRHCTLVPGWNLDCDCEPLRPEESSILLDGTRAAVEISHSILGTITVRRDPDNGQAPPLALADSIWDATDPCSPALCDETGGPAFSSLCVRRCTVIGQLLVHEVLLGEDSLFLGALVPTRRQIGCLRFSYVAPASKTPQRFNCQPDLVRAAAVDGATADSQDLRVRPALASQRYGTPLYGSLASDCAAEILRGASDESWMGAFHDLFEPQREANLRARLDEFTVAGFSTGIFPPERGTP